MRMNRTSMPFKVFPGPREVNKKGELFPPVAGLLFSALYAKSN
jgi:hypothetical protein